LGESIEEPPLLEGLVEGHAELSFNPSSLRVIRYLNLGLERELTLSAEPYVDSIKPCQLGGIHNLRPHYSKGVLREKNIEAPPR
jgi:hypothetical protein